MTTIDLLLSLGDKIAGILTLLLMNRRFSKEEEREARELVQQYDQIRETSLQLQLLIQQYNQAVETMLTEGGPQEVFPVCTYRGYQQVQRLFDSLVQYGTGHQRLEQMKVLSVVLTTHTVEELELGSTNEAARQSAEVYTREKWTAFYRTGVSSEQEVVNCYRLIRLNGDWKIDASEAFTRAAPN
jgi:hypothetical protein